MIINYNEVFTQQALDRILPPDRADRFFEALLGDASEGAYDIRLAYAGSRGGKLVFHLELHQRPGKCLACNLTYGLPNVFSRHPVIDIKSMVARIDALLNGHQRCGAWKLGTTQELSRKLHAVPLEITLLSANREV